MRNNAILAVSVLLIAGAFIFTVTAAAYPLISAQFWPNSDPEPIITEDGSVSDPDSEPPAEPEPDLPPTGLPQPVNIPDFSEEFPTCRFCM